MNSNNNPPSKHIITQIMRDRLITLEKDHNLNHAKLCSLLGIRKYKYTNIFRKHGTQIYVSHSLLEEIAAYYQCTVDYIIGASNDPGEYADGGPQLRLPFSFKDRDSKLHNVSTNLRSGKNNELLTNLDFIFSNLSDEECQNVIASINTPLTLLRKNTIYRYKDFVSPETFDMMAQTFAHDDKNYLSLLKCFSHAKVKQNKHRYKESFGIYLQIIVCCDPSTKSIAQQVVKSISSLCTTWENFPKDFKKHIPALEDYAKTVLIPLSSEVRNAIYANIPSQTFDNNTDKYLFLSKSLMDAKELQKSAWINESQQEQSCAEKLYEEAFKLYLKIIKYSDFTTTHVAKQAFENIESLCNYWKTFPDNFKQHLPNLEYFVKNIYESLNAETEKAINDVLEKRSK